MWKQINRDFCFTMHVLITFNQSIQVNRAELRLLFLINGGLFLRSVLALNLCLVMLRLKCCY